MLPICWLLSSLTCSSGAKTGTVVVKTALKHRLDNEREVLKHFQGRSCIRQLVDEIQEPAALVLEHLGNNLLSASNSKILGRPDIKLIAKRVLEALNMFHEAGYVHTGTVHGFFSRIDLP
jgi:casein kinase II subunit alpha